MSFSKDFKSLSKNAPDCSILEYWVFDNVMLADEPFTKDLRSVKNCILVYSNLCGKLVSSLESPSTFDKSLKVTLVLSFYSGS